MAMRSVGFMLKTDGKAEVKSDFAEVKKAGQDAMGGIATAAVEAGAAAATATENAERRQKASFDRMAAAAKVAAAGVRANGDVDGALGRGGNSGQFATVNLDRSRGSAAASASVFAERFAVEEEGLRRVALMEEEAAKAAVLRTAAMQRLMAHINPLYTAQKQYDDELRTWNRLLNEGVIDEARHAQALMTSKRALDAATASQVKTAANDGARRAGMVQFSQNLNDVAVQAQMGTSAMTIFSQQSGQLVGALQLMGSGATASAGRFGKLLGVLGSPWVMIAVSAATVLLPLIRNLMAAGDAADQHRHASDMLKEAMDRLAGASANAKHQTELGIQADIRAANASRLLIIEKRKQLDAELAIAKARLAAADKQAAGQGDPEGGLNAGIVAGAAAESRIAAINREIAENQRRLGDTERAGRIGETELAMRRIAGATDASTSATQRYENAIDRLTRSRQAGRIDQATFELEALQATRTRDAALQAITAQRKAETAATREQVREENAAERAAAKRLEITRQLIAANNGGDGYATFQRETEAIQQVFAAGLISPDEMQQAGQAALRKYVDGVQQAAQSESDRLRATLSSALGNAAPLIDEAQIAKSLAADVKRLDTLKRMTPEMKALRDEGARLAEQALSPDTWREWASNGKSAIRAIEDAFIKLALINPLKNLITGGSSTTLSSLFKSAVGLIGGAGAATTDRSIDTFAIGRNALGTERWSGGLSYVNENGGEIMDLPGGARIYPAAESRRMMDQAAAAPQAMRLVLETDNEMFNMRVDSRSDGRIAAAAPGIALGGAQIAQTKTAKRARYRIAGR